MIGHFSIALEFVACWEGIFSDDARDPGGATKYGITQATLSNFRGYSASKQEVRDLTREEAEKIYRKNYWDACRCDDLPAGIDLLVFDCAVNQGTKRAAKFLQQAANVAADGVIGRPDLARCVPCPARLACPGLLRPPRHRLCQALYLPLLWLWLVPAAL